MDEPSLAELLRRRLDLVARLSQATSQFQKMQLARMSADLDALRCGMSGDDAAQDLQTSSSPYELHGALCRVEEADCGMARCEALIAEIEQSLAETDGEIEALAPR